MFKIMKKIKQFCTKFFVLLYLFIVWAVIIFTVISLSGCKKQVMPPVIEWTEIDQGVNYKAENYNVEIKTMGNLNATFTITVNNKVVYSGIYKNLSTYPILFYSDIYKGDTYMVESSEDNQFYYREKE
jgi:predicted lipoprotein